jgi:hypothetical protein
MTRPVTAERLARLEAKEAAIAAEEKSRRDAIHREFFEAALARVERGDGDMWDTVWTLVAGVLADDDLAGSRHAWAAELVATWASTEAVLVQIRARAQS